ncbi:hypothetical protein M422DRAFT_36995, partial [Sphaerobolus stellatus SS14]
MSIRSEAGCALIQLVGLMLPNLLYGQVGTPNIGSGYKGVWMGGLSYMNSCQKGMRLRLMKNKGWFDCNGF